MTHNQMLQVVESMDLTLSQLQKIADHLNTCAQVPCPSCGHPRKCPFDRGSPEWMNFIGETFHGRLVIGGGRVYVRE